MGDGTGVGDDDYWRLGPAPQMAAASPLRWKVFEESRVLPVKDGAVDVANVGMPLLTGIDAPPGSVLVARMSASPKMGTDVLKQFLDALSAEQIAALPPFLDTTPFETVTLELPDGLHLENGRPATTITVRGLNQVWERLPSPLWGHVSTYYRYT